MSINFTKIQACVVALSFAFSGSCYSFQNRTTSSVAATAQPTTVPEGKRNLGVILGFSVGVTAICFGTMLLTACCCDTEDREALQEKLQLTINS